MQQGNSVTMVGASSPSRAAAAGAKRYQRNQVLPHETHEGIGETANSVDGNYLKPSLQLLGAQASPDTTKK